VNKPHIKRFFFILAGDAFSSIYHAYGILHHHHYPINLEEFEDRLDTGNAGHEDFDQCEREAKEAMRESASPFAVVFQGNRLYGVISKDRTSTHEVLL